MSATTATAPVNESHVTRRRRMLMKFSRRTLVEAMAHLDDWMIPTSLLESIERSSRLSAAIKSCAKAEAELAELDKRSAPIVQKMLDNQRISRTELKLLKLTSDAGKRAFAATKRLRAAMRKSGMALERRGRTTKTAPLTDTSVVQRCVDPTKA